MKSPAYSATPLAKKLGLKEGARIKIINPPENYFELFADLPKELIYLKDKTSKKNFIHFFVKETKRLEKEIKQLRKEIEEDGMIWISWPKKSSKIETDLNENTIREIALRNGLVDVKVCAIDNTWSGLKLVIRLKDRKK